MFRVVFVCVLLTAGTAVAQEHQHPAPAPATTPAGQEHQHPSADPAMPEHHHQSADVAERPSLFPARGESGTSWLPNNSPMYAGQVRAAGWDVMWHGNAFLQYVNESAEADRGAHQTGSINWVMAMARRPAGSGRLGVRAMLSLEPWTIRGCGYPVLLATGESCDGNSIHDRQHPHDLFMEFALEYERPISSRLRWFAYGGPVGEPALGPVAFPHRMSAFSNPFAPIDHHWLDATHITYGVFTTGVGGATWKAEGSIFNGREPDENRTDLDFGALDSYSARLSIAPTASTVFQISAGRLNDAEREGSLPATDVTRVTASATYNRSLAPSTLWASTIGWGMNDEPAATTHALLFESSLALRDRHVGFLRFEVVGKPAHDLDVHESDDVFTVSRLQLGYSHYLRPAGKLQVGLGGSVSGSFVPQALASNYGGRVAPGVSVFLTLRPSRHAM